MRAEELLDVERQERNTLARKEHWEEIRRSISHATRSRMQKSPNLEQLPDEGTIGLDKSKLSPFDATSAENASGTLNLPQLYSHDFPKDVRQKQLPRDTPKSINPPDLKDLQTMHSHKDNHAVKGHAVNEEELWKMLRLVKDVLKRPNADESGTVEAWVSDVLRLIETEFSDTPTPTNNANSTSKELTDRLSMELRLEKISMEDTQYANRLDVIRQRLGALATDMTQQEIRTPLEDKPSFFTDSEKNVNDALYADSTSNSFIWISWILVILALTVALTRLVQYYADYLATYTYYDPMYPGLFPLPAYVEALLPRSIYYNVPFTIRSQQAVVDMIEP